jgi:uncharacterized membrane protein YraQ (UPF0718 family)
MMLLNALGHALAIAGSMTWEILWALVLGFFLSGAVQAVVRKDEIVRLMPDDSPRSLAIATAAGAASSSCSSRWGWSPASGTRRLSRPA